uniref:FBA_1 domain-containing protein n=1 Tax=Panagrellus redivivus TaxID=6233 RepID=A0A7E4WD96_PANRE
MEPRESTSSWVHRHRLQAAFNPFHRVRLLRFDLSTDQQSNFQYRADSKGVLLDIWSCEGMEPMPLEVPMSNTVLL